MILSLLIGIIFAYRYIGVELANPNSVQDDFRQSFFWMWQYYDDSFLQNDFYAEMYKSHIVRLPILNIILKTVASLKIDLLAFSKYFSLVIGILSSLVSYLFISTVSKNKALNIAFTVFISFVFYCTDHISAAQARSFIWLGLMLYMYFKNSDKNISAALTTFILLFISPNTFLLCLGMEGFAWLMESVKLKQIAVKSQSLISSALNAVAAAVLYKVIFKDIQTQGVGTPFTKSELMNLPEFNPGGRHPIFGSHFWDGTWFRNEHWGFGYGYLEISNLVFIGLAAVVVYFVLRAILKEHNEKLYSLSLLALSSISLYFASQVLFPLLYLPSRYIAVPTMILAVLFIFLALEKLTSFFANNLEDVLELSEEKKQKFSFIVFVILASIFSGVFIFNEKKYIHLRYVSMNENIAKAFAAIPKDALVAGYPVLPDSNSASIITRRSVYADYERAMAYTQESLAQIRHRQMVSIAMTFAKTKEEFLTLAQKEGITHFLALLDLYSPQFLNSVHYLEPYNGFLKKTINNSGGEFFLKNYLLEHKQRYALLDIETLTAG